MTRPSSALVIGAHPDDAEFGCGGTIAGWTDAGTRVALAVLTDGSKGSHDPGLGDEELRDTREAEQRAAAQVLGISPVRFLREVDGELTERPELVRAVAEMIRELRPEIVLTHDLWRRYELHPDHVAAGQIVLRALYDAREPRAARALAARGFAPWRPRELWLFGAAEADHHEDIGPAFERKLQALLCHRSQYGTSFGIEEDPEPLRSALRRRAPAASSDAASLGESFRRLALPR